MQTSSKTTLFAQTRTLLISTATCACVLLSGCATSPTSKVAATTKAEYYPQCYSPVSQLRSSDEAVTRSIATGAIAGGLMGALAGGLADDEHRGRNAAIGAAGGALVGGAAGYYTARQKQIADDKERLASYAADFNTNNAEIDRNISYASAAQGCYERAFTQLREDRKAKKVDDAEGRKRLAEIVSGLNETNSLLAAVDGRTGQNIDTYTQAYETDLKSIGVERADVTKVVEASQPAATTKTTGSKTSTVKDVPKEAVTTEQSLQKAKVKREESRKVASKGKTMISEVCNNPDLGDWAPANCATSA